MFYVYLLKSIKNHKLYIGQTSDLKKRINTHNSKQNFSTKNGVPWELIYYEAYKEKLSAIKRELRLKNHGQALRRLKERIFF